MFVEKHHWPNADASPMFAGGYFTSSGHIEKWVRWKELPLDDLPTTDDLLASIADLSGEIGSRPTIEISDGLRVLGVDPDPHIGRLWRGVLTRSVNNKIRSGAINCGLMFGEQWFSHYLSGKYLTAARRSAESIVFEVSAGQEDRSDLTKIAVAINGWSISGIEWQRHDQCAVEVSITGAAFVNNVEMPTAGTIRYNYQQPSTLTFMIRYEMDHHGVAMSSLLDVPPEIASVQGAVIAGDEATNNRIELGDSEVLLAASEFERARYHRAGEGHEPLTSEQSSTEQGFRTYRLPAIALCAIVLALVVRSIHRRRPA